ncbi:MAG: ZIP family metal transporter [candidate division KSB1 bacterium]|nr:ZIP family metal transporter [candidate division KSB1 bacterium]
MVKDWFIVQAPVMQALVATCGTWLLTAFGAGVVFVVHGVHQKVLDAMLGFAAGVMIAATFWSLLEPAIALASVDNGQGWLPAAVGFLLGAAFLGIVDRVLPHLHLGFPIEEAEGLRTRWQRSILLVLAITLHNIPEGLAVGVSFGAAAAGIPSASLAGAVALAIGIGLQNFPEGAAVSAPLHREGLSASRSFFWGQLSGVVEPVAGVVGAAAVMAIRSLLPYALAFAAGAMIYVVVEELIPESQRSQHTHLATGGLVIGFVMMMVLDVALG